MEEWLPEAIGAGEATGLTEVLAAHLRPGALAEFDKALAAVFLAGAEVPEFCLQELQFPLRFSLLHIAFSTLHNADATSSPVETITQLAAAVRRWGFGLRSLGFKAAAINFPKWCLRLRLSLHCPAALSEG